MAVIYLDGFEYPTASYSNRSKIGESFIFNDLITGSDPDLEKAVQASRVLLHAAPVPDTR